MWVEEHLGYVSDLTRLKAYESAISRTGVEGASVLDLGCGTGVLGLLCLRSGASRVFAVDSTGMIALAQESYFHAGLRDKGVFVSGHSTRARLPELVDLVICDQVGYLGIDAGIVGFVSDARRRFLKPGGSVIPLGIHLHLAGVESETPYRFVTGWESHAVPRELRWLRGHAVNTKYPVRLKREDLLTSSATLGFVDLRRENPEFFSWTASLRAERPGILHGVVGWFECELAPGVSMTNAPTADAPIQRSQAFLPIDEPQALTAGETINVTVMLRPEHDLIAWVVELGSGRRFKHSTWEGMLLTSEELVQSAPDRMPRINPAGRARAAVLAYCDGRRTVRDIQAEVLRNHPDMFPSKAEIARFVAHVLARDTE